MWTIHVYTTMYVQIQHFEAYSSSNQIYIDYIQEIGIKRGATVLIIY